MEAASHRSHSAINAAGVCASAYVVRAGAPGPIVRTEMMVVVSVPVPEERSLIDPPRRIEAPAKRAIEDAVARNKSEGAKPGVPIPISSPPAWAAPSVHRVEASRIDVGFGQVARPQAAPAE